VKAFCRDEQAIQGQRRYEPITSIVRPVRKCGPSRSQFNLLGQWPTERAVGTVASQRSVAGMGSDKLGIKPMFSLPDGPIRSSDALQAPFGPTPL
jgi:hypothetical protein